MENNMTEQQEEYTINVEQVADPTNIDEVASTDNKEPLITLPQVVISEKDKIINHNMVNLNAVTNNTQIDHLFNLPNNHILMPSASLDRLIDAFNKVAAIEEAKLNITEEDAIAIGLTSVSSDSINSIYADTYAEHTLDNPELDNDVESPDGTKLNLRHIKVKPSEGKVTGAKDTALFNSAIDYGTPIQLPLWNSGFNITIKPPKSIDIIALHQAVAANQIELGRRTSGLVYSNYQVVLNRIVAEFIERHIIDTTLVKTNETKSLFEYISALDFPIMVNGMISAMAPSGIDVTRQCVNVLKTTEDGKPVCTFTVKGKLDPLRLPVVNKRIVSKDMLMHMSKRTKDSVTLDELNNYQDTINKLNTGNFKYVAGNGTEVIMEFYVPNLRTYINSGEQWVDQIVAAVEDIFTSNKDDATAKNDNITDIVNRTQLGLHNTFIKKISIGNNHVSTNPSALDPMEDINNALATLSTYKDVVDQFMPSIKKFIGNSTIAMIGTPNYICPTCEQAQHGESDEGVLKELIPLGVLELFFDLSKRKSMPN